MIGKVLRARLIASADIAGIVSDNISPVRFAEGQPIPAILYSTDDMAPISCRSAGNEYEGTVEIGLLATDYRQIDELIAAVRGALDNAAFTLAGWTLSFNSGTEGPDDQDELTDAYYKRLDFTVSATKI